MNSHLLILKSIPGGMGPSDAQEGPQARDDCGPETGGPVLGSGANRAAWLADHCLNSNPQKRPTMRVVVKTLEAVSDFDDVPVGPFAYTFPTEGETGPKYVREP